MAPSGALGSPGRCLQSRWHLTGGGGSGNASNVGQDRFAADGAKEGGPQPAGVKRERGGVERAVPGGGGVAGSPHREQGVRVRQAGGSGSQEAQDARALGFRPLLPGGDSARATTTRGWEYECHRDDVNPRVVGGDSRATVLFHL